MFILGIDGPRHSSNPRNVPEDATFGLTILLLDRV